MGILDKLFGRFFKSSNSYATEPNQQPPAPVHTRDWYEEEKQRLADFVKTVEPQLADTMREKKELGFSWESGGDEAFLTIADTTDANRQLYEGFEEYLIHKLEIPDAGEFEMKGEGKLFIRERRVWAAYHSNTRFLQDYDEESEQEVWEEMETEQKERMLFAL